MLPMTLSDFDFDKGNIAHLASHGVAPSDVVDLFNHRPAFSVPYLAKGEPVWVFTGFSTRHPALLLFITLRGTKIRPITGYRPRPGQFRLYF